MIAICTHEPNEAGTACRFCGIPAEPVGADELAGALIAELVVRGSIDPADVVADPLAVELMAATAAVDLRLPHCTPSAFAEHSLLCDRDGRFCSKASQHDGPCSPHGGPAPVLNALDLCNGCEVNASDPASPAGYCSTCEAEARTFSAPVAPETDTERRFAWGDR